MIGGKDAHHRIRVGRMQNLRRQADRRRRIALRRFGQHLAGRNLRKLADDFVAQKVVRQDPHAFRRNHGRQTFHGGLDQRAFPNHVEDLFGGALPAARPEARSAPSGEDQTVMMEIHLFERVRVYQL